jgi:hypothetical protein
LILFLFSVVRWGTDSFGLAEFEGSGFRRGSSEQNSFFPVARRDRRRAGVGNGVDFDLEVVVGTKTDTGSFLGGVGAAGMMFGVSGCFSD